MKFKLDDFIDAFVHILNAIASSTMAQKAPKPDSGSKEKPVSHKNITDTVSITKAGKKDDTSKLGYEVPGTDCPCKCGCDELNVTFKVHEKH